MATSALQLLSIVAQHHVATLRREAYKQINLWSEVVSFPTLSYCSELFSETDDEGSLRRPEMKERVKCELNEMRTKLSVTSEDMFHEYIDTLQPQVPT
ncbi:hypothetical protein GHT06_019051 [Daphnia sinensis]|uniref:Uncharacterized protein n=1 Tax=Daphnia sinensis TaxID=1820382 RepID=A0AAD5PNX3_9CRUS|nr:hypothetical protein GHT06_019051 [Daphnia sinensis]